MEEHQRMQGKHRINQRLTKRFHKVVIPSQEGYHCFFKINEK